MQTEHSAPFFFTRNSLLAVPVDEQGEEGAIGADRRLDHERDVAAVRRLVEILQPLAGEFLMPRQIEVASMMDALDLLKAERAAEIELNVEGSTCVVGELRHIVLMKLEPVGRD